MRLGVAVLRPDGIGGRTGLALEPGRAEADSDWTPGDEAPRGVESESM